MDLIDLQIMSVSRSSVTLQDFDTLLKLCKEKDVNSILKQDLRIYFPEGVAKFDRETIQNIQYLNRMPGDTVVSPVVCLANGTNFVAVKVEGEDFVNNHWATITSILLLIKPAYNDVEVVDADFNDEVSYYLVRF